MRYQAVIFDLDGVICHTDQFHYLAWKSVADRLGIYFDETINNRLRGVSRRESFEIILERCSKALSEEEIESCLTEKNEIYKELLKEMTKENLPASVKETLIALKNAGIKMAIGSSSKNALFILERLGLDSFFDAVSDGNNISRSKPDPEVFQKAAKYLGMQQKDCLVVEDAKAGVEAAIAGGMDCAAVGDAVLCGLAHYQLLEFNDLLSIVLNDEERSGK